MSETLTIHIIEDDDDAREALKDILELDDHRVHSFPTANDAMEFGFRGVDVVLVDRKLPDGLAEELLPRLNELAPRADFIVITAYGDMQAAIAALREGVSDYLIKPIDPHALRATLARLAKRRAVENELYRHRRFAEKLLETAEAIILVLDARGKVLRGNRYFLELTGYSLSEVTGADWFDLFVPERDRERIRLVFERTVHRAPTRGVESVLLTKDGRECLIRWSNTQLRNSAGETTAVLCVGLDVSDYVESQRKLVQSERLAAIGQTMTGLAHESRNALQRLQNSVELLQDELAGQPQALSDLDKIQRAGTHIRNLLEEVRSYAAPINLNVGKCRLPEVWNRAWLSILHLVQQRDVTFNEPPIDDELMQLSVQVDAQRLEQVFRNLFENALDAAAGPLTIEIKGQVNSKTIDITVRDNGMGVTEEYRAKLFDAFASSKPTGTGLGLAICRRTVEAHGGQLHLLPGDTGAAFQITLPHRR
jgi:PAS domain S-box-containing protein